MGTLITGRGVVRNIGDKTVDNVEEFKLELPDEEVELMSIEEYRKLELTEEQEWNNSYNPKRCSIEALNYIDIKKRGKGDIKSEYRSFSDTEYGPYYDPIGVHLCTWKNNKLIKNFKCEQDPSSESVQFSRVKPGLHCSICHKRKECRQFNWCEPVKPSRDCQPGVNPVTNEYKFTYPPVIKVVQRPKVSNAIPNWNKLMIKCIHAVYNDKIVYDISKFHSILLWPWQMTSYQKFRYNNPNYKKSVIFLESDMENFRDNYGVIE